MTRMPGAAPAEIASPSIGLPGLIVDPATGLVQTAAQWTARLAVSRRILLGELHDNPAHHELRARVVRQWAGLGGTGEPRPVIVFEHFDREYRNALGALRDSARTAPLDALLDAGHFDRKAWGWPLHRPLFEAARDSGARWVAANVSREEARSLRDKPVDPVLQRTLDDSDWPASAQQGLEERIREGHCNQLPGAAIPVLVRIQRLRDAALAGALAETPGRALLLAGNGHVGRDHGVPRYLGAASRSALVVGFIEHTEVSPDGLASLPLALLAQRYDLVCVTAPVARDDPCAAFAAAFTAGAPKRAPKRAP